MCTAEASWSETEVQDSLNRLQSAGSRGEKGDITLGTKSGESRESDMCRRALRTALLTKDVTKIWTEMSPSARARLIKTISPYTPRFRGDANAGGEAGSSAGMSKMAPEINIEDLSQDPQNFLKLLDHWSDVRPVMMHLQDLKDLKFLQSVPEFPQARDTSPLEVRALTDDNVTGWGMTRDSPGMSIKPWYEGCPVSKEEIDQIMANNREWMTKGKLMNLNAFGIVHQRQMAILQVISYMVNELISEVSEKLQNITVALVMQDVRCGNRFCDRSWPKAITDATEADEKWFPLQCSRCNLACYCSAECQKKAWKDGHREKCKPL